MAQKWAHRFLSKLLFIDLPIMAREISYFIVKLKVDVNLTGKVEGKKDQVWQIPEGIPFSPVFFSAVNTADVREWVVKVDYRLPCLSCGEWEVVDMKGKDAFDTWALSQTKLTPAEQHLANQADKKTTAPAAPAAITPPADPAAWGTGDPIDPPADNTWGDNVFVLPEYDDITAKDIRAELDTREIEYNEKDKKEVIYKLLEDSIAAETK